MEDEKDLNIVLVGMDPDFTNNIAKLLSDQFGMYYLDSMELYRFDIQPYTFTYILKKYGIEYFRDKQSSSMKYVGSFSNTVITVESGALLYQKNLDILSKDSVIIYIAIDEQKLYKELIKKDYMSRDEYMFFCLNKREILTRDEVLKNIAEIVVDASHYDVNRCLEDVTSQIMKYYGVE